MLGQVPASRGFTLFTALVAFILIVLAMLLVQAMIRAERNTTEIVADIEEQAEMQAIADLARADALQLFNYGIRLSIEDFLTVDENPPDGVPDNAYMLNPGLVGWDEIQADFARENFGGRVRTGSAGEEIVSMEFANTTANHLTTLLEQVPDARGFEFGLENTDEAMLRQSLQDVFAKSTEEGEFFEVINCPDGGFEKCLGTFYITLDLSKENMDDKVYESLPMIRVENTATRRVLKQPILPRGKFRIYVPLRVFKAIAGAREIAEGRGGVDGLFNSGFHDAIDDMKLGVCDPGYCTERTEPTAPPDGQSGSESCPRQDTTGMNTQLDTYIKDVINRRISELVAAEPNMKELAEGDDVKFPLVEVEDGNPAGKTTVVATSDPSRELVNESGAEIPGNLWCSEAQSTEAKVVFEEKNPKYMVRGTGAEGTVQRYAVVLYDGTYTQLYNAEQNKETCISGEDSCRPG